MAINNKVKVAVIGSQNRSVLLNPQATEGAVFGKDLFFGDGKTVVTLQNLATALGIKTGNSQPNVLWNQLAAIPPNVIEVANLATAGVVRRLPNGKWITQPPSDFVGRPGAPGRAGRRGPPGVPGAPGTAGARGTSGVTVIGRRGPRGLRGIPGPIGARGATGATGPAGASSSASGFPGYRQSKPQRRMLPPLDNAATVTWGGLNVFASVLTPKLGARVGGAFGGRVGFPALYLNAGGNAANNRAVEIICAGGFAMNFMDDAGTAGGAFLSASRSGAATATVTLGNNTDNPPIGMFGNVTMTASPAGGTPLTLTSTATSTAFTLSNASTARGFIGCVNSAGAFINNTAVGDVGIRVVAGNVVFSIDNGTTDLTFNSNPTTGAQNPSGFINNKPGSTGGGPTRWLGFKSAGTQYWIPLYPN